MSDSIFKLQLLAKAELALTEIRAKRAAARTAYTAFALALILLALMMLNLAAYLALSESWGAPEAALTVALINAGLGLLVLFLGSRAGPSEGEERMARELREMAYREVSEDVEHVKEKLENLSQDVSRIGENVGRVAGTAKFLLSALGGK